MKEVMNYDENLIQNIINYYKDCSTALVLNSENISEYRKKLIGVINDDFIISSSGTYLYKNINDQRNNTILSAYNYSTQQSSIRNFFLYLRLQYEEDLIIDEIYKDIGKNVISTHDITKSKFSFSKPDYTKSFFYEDINPIENTKQNLLISIEKIYKQYVYKKNANYIAMADFNGKKFPIKLKHNVYDSGTYIINDILQNNISNNIRIVEPLFVWSETMNQKNILVVSPYAWILEKG